MSVEGHLRMGSICGLTFVDGSVIGLDLPSNPGWQEPR